MPYTKIHYGGGNLDPDDCFSIKAAIRATIRVAIRVIQIDPDDQDRFLDLVANSANMCMSSHFRIECRIYSNQSEFVNRHHANLIFLEPVGPDRLGPP